MIIFPSSWHAPIGFPIQKPLQAAVGGPIGLLVDGDMVTVRPGSRELSVALSEEVGSQKVNPNQGLEP